MLSKDYNVFLCVNYVLNVNTISWIFNWLNANILMLM
jgi:hypothetical protein